MQIDGTFRLQKPPVLLGYQSEMRAKKPSGVPGEESLEMGIGSGDDTYLTMFVTIEPALTPAEPAKEKVCIWLLSSVVCLRLFSSHALGIFAV